MISRWKRDHQERYEHQLQDADAGGELHSYFGNFFLWYNVFESIKDGCKISFQNNNASGPSHLEGMSLLVLVDGGEDGLVDAEAHGGGDQRKGEVSDHAEGTFVEKDVQKEVSEGGG